MSYVFVENEGEKALTIYHEGRMGVTTGNTKNFSRVHELAKYGLFREALALIDTESTIRKKFEKLSDRVAIRDGIVYFDGDAVHNTLTEHIVRLHEANEDFESLVNFYDRAEQNPNEHSRRELYRWLNSRDFTITEDGNFIGYKGVTRREDGRLYSIHSGKAIVDGIEVNGQVENRIGSTIEMARSEVQHDPSIGCHTGLHVGTWEYASGFAQGAILTVEVDPRDVVSVPTDCNDEKLRCCRYTVIDETDHQITTPTYDQYDYNGFDYDYDECDPYECHCEECEDERDY